MLILLIMTIYNNYLYKLIYNFLRVYKNSPIVQIFGYVYIFKLLLKTLFYSNTIFKLYIKKIPYIKNKIDNETTTVIKKIKQDFDEEVSGIVSYSKIPNEGIPDETILNYFTSMKKKCTYDYTKGRVSGSVYSKNHTLDLLHSKLYLYFNKSNPLHSSVFPSIRFMENNLVSMMISLFNGHKDVCGTFTSGGTESILLACKTYRDYFKHIKYPEIIIHPAAGQDHPNKPRCMAMLDHAQTQLHL